MSGYINEDGLKRCPLRFGMKDQKCLGRACMWYVRVGYAGAGTVNVMDCAIAARGGK